MGKVGVNTHANKGYLCLQVRGDYEVPRLHVNACALIWAWRVSTHLGAFACECVTGHTWDSTVICFAPGGGQ